MTDIWDEKPKIAVSHVGPWGECNFYYYDKEEMDAWLEKLQEEVLTAWTKDENRLTKIIVERGRKLEAVEKWRNKWGLNLSDRQYKELEDILHLSSTSTNSHNLLTI